MIYYIYGLFIKNFLYVGSTQDLNVRKLRHKSNCNNNKSAEYNRKVYKTIRANGGWDDCCMEIIDEVECQAETEITPIEEFYRVALGADLNGKKCHRTKEEKIKYDREHSKKWNRNNLDYYKRKYNCNCGGKYTYASKARHIKTKTHQDYLLKLTNI